MGLGELGDGPVKRPQETASMYKFRVDDGVQSSTQKQALELDSNIHYFISSQYPCPPHLYPS